MPTLYLVGTPIGNLEDITLRALRILGEVSLVAAEDKLTTGRLLKHYDIQTPMVSYHEYSGPGRLSELVQSLASADIALVSDAGMPGLSDPGFELVKEAIETGFQVIPVPGPSAFISALVASGLPANKFLFLGFLPRQRSARKKALAQVARLPYTLVLYEAPHRLLPFLADAQEVLGDRQLSIGRELTKYHEEIWRGTTSQAAIHFEKGGIKGEITVIISGAEIDEAPWQEKAVCAALADELKRGLSRKDAVALVAQMSGWSKRKVYHLSLDLN